MNTRHLIASMAMALLAAVTNLASAGGLDIPTKIYGRPAPAETAARSIDVQADTAGVIVTDGEIVRFNIDGKSYGWHFDLFHEAGAVKLSLLVPEAKTTATVYVRANPLYRELYRN